MAVFTHLSDPEMADFVAAYDVGTFVSAKGILAGVENTNYVVDTDTGRCVLTVVEYRTNPAAMPFIVGFQRHLAKDGLSVPAPLMDKTGAVIGMLQGKPAVLSPFLNGASIFSPSCAQVYQLGAMIARMHRSGATFDGMRDNPVGLPMWGDLTNKLVGKLTDAEIADLRAVQGEYAALDTSALPRGAVHVDIFPDNVFFDADGNLSAVIDFYFSCIDTFAYDLAITANAWVFDKTHRVDAALWNALVDGYQSVRVLTDAEKSAFPTLRRAAAMRILLTRAYDWHNRPEGAQVTPKDTTEYPKKMGCDFVWF